MRDYQSISDEGAGIPFQVTAIAAEGGHDPSVDGDGVAPQRDHLSPPFESGERPSGLLVGTFNLIATIVGGGVLSLPIVFERCGVAFTTLAMILSAYMTYMSLMMLCYCSRRGGGSSYGEVVRSAFGEAAEKGASRLLCAYLMLSIVAYMVLSRDIWTPLARRALGTDVDGDRVLLLILGILLPCLLQRSLHALRGICYVGFASIVVLCIALCRGGFDKMTDSDGDFGFEIFKVPGARDLLFSFPIVTCAFLCHFNILAIQNALTRPTRERMQSLTRYAVGACFLLMYIFGLGGAAYGGKNTEGNILLNVPTERRGEDDHAYYLFLLGRVGCGVTIMFAMPISMLPCREIILEALDFRSHQSTSHSAKAMGKEDTMQSLESCNTLSTDSTIPIHHEPIPSGYGFRHALAHYGSTLFIAAACYVGAVAVSGVAAVWSFIGSSLAFLIAFIMPCGCFIAIEGAVPSTAQGGDRKDCWIQFAWAILAFSIIGAVVCTVNNTVGLRH